MFSINTNLILDFKRFGKPDNFEARNKLLNKFSVVYYWYHLTSVTFISLGSLFAVGKCRRENEKRGISEVCGLIARIWLPFDYDFSPLKEILYSYEVCM